MANRYDNGSVAKFNPLSFNELAAVPTMIRKKHDDSIAAAEAMRIQADPLKEHYARALELKQQMDNEIAKNVDTLNKEGYNPTTFQNITKLNRQYQDLISPTGEIGKINTAKKVYDANQEEFIDDATKTKGWSRERAISNWNNKFANQYTGFGEDGKSIVNIGQYGAPKKVEVMDVLKDVHGLLGEQVVGEMRASGYSFQPSPDGGMVMVDRSGRRIETSNKPNLRDAQNLINQKLVGKEWQDSINFEGENTKNIYNQLTSGINAMVSNKVVDNRSENAQHIAPKTGDGEDSEDGSGVIINNDSTLKSDAVKYTNYSDVLNARKILMKSNSSKDRAELSDLEDLHRNADSKLKSNPKYKESQQSLLSKQKEFDNLIKDYNSGKIKMTPSQYVSQYKMKEADIHKAKNEITNIKDKAWKDSSSSRHSYSYLPTNSKEQTNWDIYNKGVFNTLKGGNLANLLDVSSIHTNNGSKTNVSNTDVNNIQALLNNSNENSFTINSVKTYGSNKTPEITMTFIPGEGGKEYTMDRKLFTDYNDYGGANKPVTVTFRLKDFSNASKTGSAKGYKSLSGAITDFWKDKGSVNKLTGNFQGAEVKDAFVKSEYSKYTNDQLNDMRNVDEDAKRALEIRYMEYQASKR